MPQTAATMEQFTSMVRQNNRSAQEARTLACEAAEAGSTMDSVVASIARVSEIVTQISHASIEQSTGIEQIGKAVTQMDDATQQNSALVEQSAAAAESLEEQARQLQKQVAGFRLAHA